MTYFGVQMSAGNLGGDFFLNFLLMGIAEFPGYIAGIMLTDRIGRRLSHSGSMFVGGLACLSSLFVVYFGSSGKCVDNRKACKILFFKIMGKQKEKHDCYNFCLPLFLQCFPNLLSSESFRW